MWLIASLGDLGAGKIVLEDSISSFSMCAMVPVQTEPHLPEHRIPTEKIITASLTDISHGRYSDQRL